MQTGVHKKSLQRASCFIFSHGILHVSLEMTQNNLLLFLIIADYILLLQETMILSSSKDSTPQAEIWKLYCKFTYHIITVLTNEKMRTIKQELHTNAKTNMSNIYLTQLISRILSTKTCSSLCLTFTNLSNILSHSPSLTEAYCPDQRLPRYCNITHYHNENIFLLPWDWYNRSSQQQIKHPQRFCYTMD